VKVENPEELNILRMCPPKIFSPNDFKSQICPIILI